MMNNLFPMMVMMMVSGLLTTMNVWADKLDDIRWSINDLYMAVLMTGWMVFFMGVYEGNMQRILLGGMFVMISFVCIRKQLFVSVNQYYKGMIPHHSMAVHMSKNIVEQNLEWIRIKESSPIQRESEFAQNIINNQNKEIEYMKKYLQKKLKY
jgi:uncharacterized protein (DUF305 family)